MIDIGEYKTVDEVSFGVKITPVAKEQIIKRANKDGKQRVLRVEVTIGGCNGKQYLFSMAQLSSEDIDVNNDIIVTSPDPLVVVDRNSLKEISGAILDYIDSLQWTGFVIIDNPRAKSSCGCGASFA